MWQSYGWRCRGQDEQRTSAAPLLRSSSPDTRSYIKQSCCTTMLLLPQKTLKRNFSLRKINANKKHVVMQTLCSNPSHHNAPSTLALPGELRASTTQTAFAARLPPASTRPERPEMRRTRPGERLRSWAAAGAPARPRRPDLPDNQTEQKEV